MAYASLVAVTTVNAWDHFTHMRDFICKRNGTYDYSTTGIGWTLHDSSYAIDEDNISVGDWCVFYSAGEGGKDDMYYRMTYVSTIYISIHGFLYWNNTTHAGVYQFGTVSNWQIVAVSNLYIGGDLDFVIPTTVNAAVEPQCPFGKLLRTDSPDTIAQSAGSPASGLDISITLDVIPADWVVGRKVFIRDNANIELVTIKTLGSLTITVDLVAGYTTPKMSTYVPYMCPQSNYSLSSSSQFRMIIGPNNVKNWYCLAPKYSTGWSTYVSPDDQNLENGVSSLHIMGSEGYAGMIPHCYHLHGTGGGVLMDIYETQDGTQYRYMANYTALVVVKEV